MPRAWEGDGNYSQGRRVFAGLPRDFLVTRYHSLTVSGRDFPQELLIDAVSEEGVIMGISHRIYPVYGVAVPPGSRTNAIWHGAFGEFQQNLPGMEGCSCGL